MDKKHVKRDISRSPYFDGRNSITSGVTWHDNAINLWLIIHLLANRTRTYHGFNRVIRRVSGQIAERRFAECHFAECISSNVILQMCFCRHVKKSKCLKLKCNLPTCLFEEVQKVEIMMLPGMQKNTPESNETRPDTIDRNIRRFRPNMT